VDNHESKIGDLDGDGDLDIWASHSPIRPD
jgi:hypothetical protein